MGQFYVKIPFLGVYCIKLWPVHRLQNKCQFKCTCNLFFLLLLPKEPPPMQLKTILNDGIQFISGKLINVNNAKWEKKGNVFKKEIITPGILGI